MLKRERLEKTFAGEVTDRIPVALWRHWPGDDQRTADFAQAIIQFQQQYDWDFVRVAPSSTYCVADYGLKDEWQGALDGDRVVTRHPVNRSLEWTELRPLDPIRGELGKQIETLRLIAEEMRGDDTPILATVYSPMAQAARLGGHEFLIRCLRTVPDRLRTALNILTENTLRFIDSLRPIDIAGIIYVIEHATFDVLSEQEYAAFGVAYDRKILESLPAKWWFNTLHLSGNLPMFSLVANYPVHSINWNDSENRPDLTKGKALFRGAVCGGISAYHLHNSTPAIVRETARDAIERTNGCRFILSSGCVPLITSPLSNFRAAREIVETARKA